ncbi:hypothetical protein AB0B30_34800 [Streptomyces narbonensis]|uniref:Uncharacterized protein n=1 Tax=Streptomyces narbonensis TaxID=67333 RepID=A0ABV3CC16_9ACTN
MPASTPPPPGRTKYTRWHQVPDGLHTKTQLAERDPPLKPGADPVAQVLYHGNSCAPLYDLTAAIPKRRATPAQRAVLDRARELQYVCRRCGVRDDEPLGKGRWCMRCSYAVTMWEKHAQAQSLARELVADPAAVLLVVDTDPGGLPDSQAVAVVRIPDHQVLSTAEAGEYGTPERAAVVERLDVLLAGRRVVRECDLMGPTARIPFSLISLPREMLPSAAIAEHAWMSSEVLSVAGVWAAWYAWTDNPSSTLPAAPGYGKQIAWQRSPFLASDAQSMTELLHRIADGAEPVWEKARWLADGHGVPVTTGVHV